MNDRNLFDYSKLHPLFREEMEARDKELSDNVKKWNSEPKKEDPNLLKDMLQGMQMENFISFIENPIEVRLLGKDMLHVYGTMWLSCLKQCFLI